MYIYCIYTTVILNGNRFRPEYRIQLSLNVIVKDCTLVQTTGASVITGVIYIRI